MLRPSFDEASLTWALSCLASADQCGAEPAGGVHVLLFGSSDAIVRYRQLPVRLGHLERDADPGRHARLWKGIFDRVDDQFGDDQPDADCVAGACAPKPSIPTGRDREMGSRVRDGKLAWTAGRPRVATKAAQISWLIRP